MSVFWSNGFRLLVWMSLAIRDVWIKRLAIRELQRLNDPLLRGIGVARTNIEAFVDKALAERRAERRALEQIDGDRKADLHASELFHARR